MASTLPCKAAGKIVISISKTSSNKGLNLGDFHGGDTAVPNPEWDDQIDMTAASFFVRQGTVKQRLCIIDRLRGETKAFDSAKDPIPDIYTAIFFCCCGPCYNAHTDGNGLSVGNGKVAFGFHTVTDGVSEIQLHPVAGVEFVFHDYIALQLHTTGNDGFPGKTQPSLR